MTADRAPARGAPAPRILVTRAENVVGERWEDYADAVRRAGGAPEPIDLGALPEPGGARALPAFDGLVVTAGVDVDPARYGAERAERVLEVNPERDEFEASLIQEATRRGMPVFAICRGSQILNVARGGSLIQHLEEREPHRARRGADGVSIGSGWHPVAVAAGSLLARVAGAGPLHVNSRHHQAIPSDGVAPGLRATGVAPDGVVEAIEDSAQPWVLGVQWHPERPEMIDDPRLTGESVRLFEAFVAACARAAAGASRRR